MTSSEAAVPLDHVAGNQLPFFLVGAVRRCRCLLRRAVLRILRARVRTPPLDDRIHVVRLRPPLAGEPGTDRPREPRPATLAASPPRQLAQLLHPSERDLHPASLRPSGDRPPGHARPRTRETRRQPPHLSEASARAPPRQPASHPRRMDSIGWADAWNPTEGAAIGKARGANDLTETAAMTTTSMFVGKEARRHAVTMARMTAKVGLLPLGIRGASPCSRCRDPRLSPGRRRTR